MGVNQTVVYLDSKDRVIHYYSMPDGEKASIIHEKKPFKPVKFDEEFYAKLSEILFDFQSRYPGNQATETTLVLPDNVIFLDTITLPQMKDLKNSLDSTITGLYKDAKAMKFNIMQATSTKQFTTYALTGIRNQILEDVRAALTNGKFPVGCITYASSAETNAVSALNPSLKSATYLFMDIKENFTKVIYVFKGNAVGFTTLPFGYRILSQTKLAAEDMLFNHQVADLAVLNAREKAKSKDLTIAEDNSEAVIQGEEFKDEFLSEKEELEGAADNTVDEYNPFANYDSNESSSSIKVLPKKQARKLPKFMLREVPQDERQMIAENFRIFEKWALCFAQGNDNLRALEDISAVYVNMPERFDFVYDMANLEQTENVYKFLPLGIQAEAAEIRENLELFGGFFAKRIGTSKNF